MIINDILDLNFRKRPRALALVVGEHRVSFEALYRGANRLAHALRARMPIGERVAILGMNSPAYVEAMYGVPAAGMTLVLLNYRLHPLEWARLLIDSDARALIVDRDLFELLRPHLTAAHALETIFVIGGAGGSELSYEEQLAREPDGAVLERPASASVAFMIYTSGTTGFPKGVMISHGNIIAASLCHIAEFNLREDASYLQAYPLCHASGFQVFICHSRGIVLHMPASFEAGAWLDTIQRERITHTTVAPTMANFIMQHERWDSADISSLELLYYGSMPMPAAMARAFLERGVRNLGSGFGQSETTLTVTQFSAEEHRIALQGREELLGSCGKANMLSAIKLFDDQMREVPVGEVGEMCVRSPLVMQGYWRNEEGTREAFAGDWLHTGDLAYADADGRLYIVDRMKDMIKTGGQNVYSRELEQVLSAHPAIFEVAVIGVPDPVWGENVVAAIVLRPGANTSAQQITEYFLQHLASYKKPKHIVFFDQMPKNVTGKIVKRELREQIVQKIERGF